MAHPVLASMAFKALDEAARANAERSQRSGKLRLLKARVRRGR